MIGWSHACAECLFVSAVHMLRFFRLMSLSSLTLAFVSLSWADTAVSTISRLHGPCTPKLPAPLPFPPSASKVPRGFIAAILLTGVVVQPQLSIAVIYPTNDYGYP